MIRNHKFSSQFYRLLIAGIIIFSGLYFGFSFQTNPTTPKVGVRNVSANISSAIKDGLDVYVGDEVAELSGEEIKSWTETYIRDYSGQKDTRINNDKVGNDVNSFPPRVNINAIDAKFEMNAAKVDAWKALTLS